MTEVKTMTAYVRLKDSASKVNNYHNVISLDWQDKELTLITVNCNMIQKITLHEVFTCEIN